MEEEEEDQKRRYRTLIKWRIGKREERRREEVGSNKKGRLVEEREEDEKEMRRYRTLIKERIGKKRIGEERWEAIKEGRTVEKRRTGRLNNESGKENQEKGEYEKGRLKWRLYEEISLTKREINFGENTNAEYNNQGEKR